MQFNIEQKTPDKHRPTLIKIYWLVHVSLFTCEIDSMYNRYPSTHVIQLAILCILGQGDSLMWSIGQRQTKIKLMHMYLRYQ